MGRAVGKNWEQSNATSPQRYVYFHHARQWIVLPTYRYIFVQITILTTIVKQAFQSSNLLRNESERVSWTGFSHWSKSRKLQFRSHFNIHSMVIASREYLDYPEIIFLINPE
ncbi:hypothetical protein BC936DRAFT_144192 [Jimgerdemannia flammicorona]|uniref:Uncharacterized protein n=1 Tax=Jimgerdemannia flammicorona TaxID=994334 RepID=A0A433DM41_9FUNG|nr:hypothetical protein BC936DRAFT_144192 [Jimgerdemannia flammicorona]